jgi:predicted CoA-substrate-specific enzyme activase
MTQELHIGIDVGSVSVKTVFVDEELRLLEEDYRRAKGRPLLTAMEVLEWLLAKYPEAAVRAIAVTGSGGAALSECLGAAMVNEIIAQSTAVALFLPRVRTVIEMGGQDSKLLLFEYDEFQKRLVLQDFAMNSLCAAGTGSFLDQQATRLGLAIEEEFGALALKSQHPPRIAGRCSVFAKSDMIHLQQIATPDYDIVAGLCLALARNFKSTLGKGKRLHLPVAFLGGVAANIGMVRAFERVLELGDDELVIPPHHATMGAIGAIRRIMEEGRSTEFRGLAPLRELLGSKAPDESRLAPLHAPSEHSNGISGEAASVFMPGESGDGDKIDAYLGIDVGSISTNVVAIDRNNRLLAKRYLMTASRPIDAVRHGLAEIGQEIGDRIRVCGIGTTGSGRYLIGDIVGADLVCNEITAQATASIIVDREVDTIFEIGGQDSKYISLENGAIVDFEMNKVCAAGTGSFLEEQAERLDVSIKEEFSERALSASRPVALGDRCTVFMESDLLHYQQRGVDKGDLLAGLAYSIVYNYLNRVVGEKRIGTRIFFQGGVAFNQSVIAAFERVLGQPVAVPPHHDVTGAIGVAIVTKERHQGPSRFKGFGISNRKYKVTTFECSDCPNVCEIRKVEMEHEQPLYYGSRCEKYDVDRAKREESDIPDLFAEREKLLFGHGGSGTSMPSKGTVGIPCCMSFYELLPFWRAFFESLGFRVVVSGRTNKPIIHRGVESVVAESCFPIKVAQGHILTLMERDVDFIFLPSIIDAPTPEFGPKDKCSFNCPYIQTLPYTAAACDGFRAERVEVFSPILHMQYGPKHLINVVSEHRRKLRSTGGEIARAVAAAYAAQEEFDRALIRRGREVLEQQLSRMGMAVVIVSRPYNGCDPGLNLDLPKKLRKLGVLALPMDMLPLDEMPLSPEWHRMYWRYGQRIIKTARLIREHPQLYGLYVTNFGCGPDSFMLKFFAKEMQGKPFLQIEIDEHSADAGTVTRCEAFLDTLKSYEKPPVRDISSGPIVNLSQMQTTRQLYLPYMAEHAWGLEAALRASGIEAQVLPPSDEESLEWGRKYTSGKECYPAVLTVGDIIRKTKERDFDPQRAAFFMAVANGPCRFGQYHKLHRFVLDEIGLSDVPVVILDQDANYHQDLGGLKLDFEKTAWKAITAIDVMVKYLLETRPYEVHRGECDAVFKEAIEGLRGVILARKNIWSYLKEIHNVFDRISANGRGERPRLGIVGEIYVRSNPFSNDNIIRRIEALGGEVVIPPMSEWINYTTYVRKRRNWRRSRYGHVVQDVLREHLQHYLESRVYRTFGRRTDPSPQSLLSMSKPYLDPSFEGEAVLSVGKAIEYITHHDVAGIINIMPFTCMPGTIVTAVMNRVRETHQSVPFITMSYTGQQNLNTQLRLEAFMYQALQYWRERRKKGNLKVRQD